MRMPGGSSAGSSLGDSGGLTMGVVNCGSVYMLVLVSGSQVICKGKRAAQEVGRQLWGAWNAARATTEQAIRSRSEIAPQRVQAQTISFSIDFYYEKNHLLPHPPTCAYSSCLASWMSAEAPLPKASSMPASFFTRLQRGAATGRVKRA